MASWIRALLTSTLLVLCIATPSARAAPAPIVFDFEDGLQGWSTFSAATRVQTQVLGGEWAMFGDALVGDELLVLPPEILINIDLTNIGIVSLELFVIDGEGSGPTGILRGGVGITFPFAAASPGNPNFLTIDLSAETGFQFFEIVWLDISAGPAAPLIAFIDNITFHPVPEPGTLVLLAFGLAALALVRVLAA